MGRAQVGERRFRGGVFPGDESLSLRITGILWPCTHLGCQPQGSPQPLTHSELVVEPVGEQGVGQLPEVGLAQGGHTVDVLQVHVPPQVWLPLSLELLPGEVHTLRGGGRVCRVQSGGEDTRACPQGRPSGL